MSIKELLRNQTTLQDQISLHGCWLIFSFAFIWSFNSLLIPTSSNLDIKPDVLFWGITGVIGLVISMLLHEAGHILISQIFGVSHPQKKIFPFGDVITRYPHTHTIPESIPLVALAGPITSLLIAAILNLFNTFFEHQLNNTFRIFITIITNANLTIAFINLLPCKPFDGWLFLLYAENHGDNSSWRYLSKASKYIPIVCISSGLSLIYIGSLYHGIWFILAGFIVREALFSTFNSTLLHQLQTPLVADFMRRNPITVQSNISLREFVTNYPLRFSAGIFPVFSGNKLKGYIEFKKISTIPEKLWNSFTVGELVEKCSDKNTISPSTEVIKAINLMVKKSTNKLLVLEYGDLMGVITWKDLSNYFYKSIFTKHPKNKKTTAISLRAIF